MNPREVVVEADAIGKTYRLDGREIEVLKGVKLTLRPGETAAIVGPSGAGKSTLLHIIGLLESPTMGSLRLDGCDAGVMNEHDRARYRLERIGFVFQFHHLLPEFTALENVMIPGMMRGNPFDVCRGRAEALLGLVGLLNRMQHKPGELSGGEQQRVALARALMNEPRLILADEPTGNLDSRASESLREILWGICREKGAALLLVTHNERIARGAARTYTMTDGTLSGVM